MATWGGLTGASSGPRKSGAPFLPQLSPGARGLIKNYGRGFAISSPAFLRGFLKTQLDIGAGHFPNPRQLLAGGPTQGDPPKTGQFSLRTAVCTNFSRPTPAAVRWVFFPWNPRAPCFLYKNPQGNHEKPRHVCRCEIYLQPRKSPPPTSSFIPTKENRRPRRRGCLDTGRAVEKKNDFLR